MLRLGKSHVVAHEMDYDSTERLTQCFAAIESPESETTRVWLENCRESFSLMISEKLENDTKFTDVKEYLDHVVKSTNMRCLTPESALDGECGFLAANLYAKSVFGEDALVNVSVEKDKDGKLGGYIRIRSKTQGIALSLGDKITLKQRGPEK